MTETPPASPQDVLRLVEEARGRSGVALAAMWGAVRATAPADRWAKADRSLAEGVTHLQSARAALARIEKREAYCTTCGGALILGGLAERWEHWPLGDAGHEAVMDWRPVESSREEAPDAQD